MSEPPSHADLVRRLHGWARTSGCHLCVLFGSRAEGSPTFRADVDIAVQFPALPEPERRLDLIGELQDLCGESTADVVFLRPGMDPVLRFEIFRGGRPVFEARQGLFVEEKVRSLMLFEDALPFRRMLRERLKGGAEGRRHVP